MKDFLSSLTERTSEFGNHYRKYIQAISRNLNPLIQRLEEKKQRDLVHILHLAYDIDSEMNIIAAAGETKEEKLKFLGTYFALQFLLMNHQAIDLLRMDVIGSGDNKFFVYKKFMVDMGNKFRLLTAHYIKELLDIFIPEKDRPEFVILGVGTKSDQDDIDVGIIDSGTRDRDKFNRAIALVSQEMVKFATSFHFHLSEHIGGHYYSASIVEYKDVLRHQIRDFVIINEMLSGSIIIGSERMFERYRKEIIDRYFYHPSGNNKYHEGYLRGILGEISSLLARPISATHINFKEDALRVIKSIISAQKTVFNVPAVNAWDIIDALRNSDTKRYHEYNALERSLTFFEIIRNLYQSFVTQDEEIVLDDTSQKNLRRVARVVGYSDIGKCRAEEHLLVHYYEHIQNIRKIIPLVLNDIKAHLRKHSVFAPMFHLNYQGNIPHDFIQKFRFFRGTSFWDDVIDDFRNEELLKRFVDDLNALTSDRRNEMIKQYIAWVKYDFYSLIKFVTTLGKSKSGFPIYKDLNNHLLKTINRIPDVVRHIAYVFYRYPHLINNYLSLNEEKHLNYYLTLIDKKVYEVEITTILNNLKHLITIHLVSSQFFGRFFLRILDKYPESITLLKKPHRLREFADGIYSDIDSMRMFEEKKEKLGDYYDFEIMRVGLNTLSGVPVETTNAEFTDFSDKYIHMLFDVCRREVDAQYTKRMITEDLLAIFAAGGHAREQAYDDDYDIIVILNADNPEVLSYCNIIISKMNREIIKRGTIPHHRFAEYFGRFVILLAEIDQLLCEERSDIFIEKSQMLGARLIVGSHRFENEFLERIVRPHIFEKSEAYIEQMIGEISSRHLTEREGKVIDNNIKESIGGLRDIEMMMFIVKAKFNIKEPVNSKLFEDVANRQQELKADLCTLANAFSFLKQLRDIYRLTAGASDEIISDALQHSANIMGYRSGKELYKKFNEVRREVQAIIQNLINKMTKKKNHPIT